MTGGAFGSLFAQLFHLSSAERKTLVVAGAAGGMAAVFATPVAAVLLAVELLLFEWKPRSFIPVAVASTAAAILRVPLLGAGPIFPVIPHGALGAGALGMALAVGVFVGLGSCLLTVLVYAFEDLFQRLPLHWMWWPALGAVVVGIGGWLDPRVLGVGYETIHSMLGNGTGLLGKYYRNTLSINPFVGTPLTRTDPTIDFNWNAVSPDPSIPPTNYTVRWTGMVQPLFNETYSFSTTTDDGVRLWVNGQELINEWVPQAPTTWSGSISLQALQLYPVEMDYFQAGGGAVAELSWSSPSTMQSIIPQSQLYPFSSALPLLFTTSQYFTNNDFSLQLSGMPGRNYVLQASTNLVDWISLSTNVPPTTIMNLTVPQVTDFTVRFYRAVQLP